MHPNSLSSDPYTRFLDLGGERRGVDAVEDIRREETKEFFFVDNVVDIVVFVFGIFVFVVVVTSVVVVKIGCNKGGGNVCTDGCFLPSRRGNRRDGKRRRP